MIGIVLVSHSAKLAEGVLELAREMAGPEVVIAACGGLDLPGQPLGTDPARVADAIQNMLSESAPVLDGILVLMDLGSALLSAAMALDLLPAELRAKVRLCPAPLVEGAVAAAVQARLGSTLEQAAAEASRSLEPKTSQLDGQVKTEIPAQDRMPETAPEEENQLSIQLTVSNPLGLHARPAARLVQLAAGHPGVTLRITNLTRSTGPANARSINALAILGVRQGHVLKAEASGPGAREVLRDLEQLCREGFGDSENALPNQKTG